MGLIMHEGMPQLIRKQPPACCVVCGGRLLARQLADAQQSGNAYPACETVACRMIVSRRGEMSEAGFKHYLQIEASQTQWRLARAELMREKIRLEAQENAAAWAALRLKLKRANQDSTLSLLLPSGPPRARKLTQQRRHAYRDHLAKIIAEALSGPGPGPEPLAATNVAPLTKPSESSLPGRLCAFCGGGCCTRGGERAYLSAATMRRVLAAQPDLASAGALIEAYMAMLPAKSQTGSCINHGPQGCSLSREMRSDICNNYACEALARLQHAQSHAAEPPQTVLLLRRSRDNWQLPSVGPDNAIKAAAVMSEEGGVKRFTAAALLGSKPAL